MRCLDVTILSSLVSTGQQNHVGVGPSKVIHAIPGAIIDPQLGNATTDRPHVARIA
jgi:hypothetical protein